MTPGELRRLYFIIHTFLSYGLDELIPKMRITLPLRIWRRMLFWMPNRHQDQPLGARLRLALQELGPVWIKFGQMLSTRRDLFPPHIADQLALLQDRVAPFEGKLAQQQIEKAMGGLPVETWFDDFSVEPLASASIAQVHTARLKENGKEVVIKVIRPDILPIIKADMKLIYRLARWVPRLLPDGRRLRPQEVVREYEKTLLDELNLLRESANAIQLRRNFEDSPMLYVPEVRACPAIPWQHIKLCRAFIITITTFLENDSEIGIAGIFNGARGFVDLILETRFSRANNENGAHRYRRDNIQFFLLHAPGKNRDGRFFKDHPIISLNVISRPTVIEFKILLAIGLYGELQRRPDQVFVLTGHRPFITVARPGDFVSRDGI